MKTEIFLNLRKEAQRLHVENFLSLTGTELLASVRAAKAERRRPTTRLSEVWGKHPQTARKQEPVCIGSTQAKARQRELMTRLGYAVAA